MPSNRPQNAEQARLVNNTGRNHPDSFNSQGYNTFDRSSCSLQTQRFAEVNPIYAADLIPGERPRIISEHELRSFTLKSPLMSDVFMHRSFFVVPLSAIYPNTWKIQIKPRPFGSDIGSFALPGLSMNRVKGNSNSLYQLISTLGRGSRSDLALWFEGVILFMQMFSQDSLLHKLGYGFPDYDVDSLADLFLNTANYQVSFVVSYTYDNGNSSDSIDLADTSIALERRRFVFFQILKNKYTITNFNDQGSNQSDWDPTGTYVSGSYGTVGDAMMSIFNAFPTFSSDLIVNLERVVAYQMICAQFYTNPYIDNIVDGKGWLDNQMSIYKQVLLGSTGGTFTSFISFVLNGVNYDYDFASNRVLSTLFEGMSASTIGSTTALKKTLIKVLRNLFEIHDSLRVTDYFVDGRVQPLAVGDVYSAVVSNQVSAVDINQSLWLQRLYNAVQRIPDNVNDYIRQMFGHDPQSKYPQPMEISHETFLISGQEVENTSDVDQGNVVSLLRSQQSNFQFEFKVSEHSILIGLNSYSMVYNYATAMDRVFYNRTRLDRFNPYFQHVGDQRIYYDELDNDANSANFGGTFGYQLRYAEYKNGINHASSAFAHGSLPSWAAIYNRSNIFNYRVLSSEFIRNNNFDFDQFYSSLSGTNPCNYFHFICKFKTKVWSNSQQQKYPSLM